MVFGISVASDRASWISAFLVGSDRYIREAPERMANSFLFRDPKPTSQSHSDWGVEWIGLVWFEFSSCR